MRSPGLQGQSQLELHNRHPFSFRQGRSRARGAPSCALSSFFSLPPLSLCPFTFAVHFLPRQDNSCCDRTNCAHGRGARHAPCSFLFQPRKRRRGKEGTQRHLTLQKIMNKKWFSIAGFVALTAAPMLAGDAPKSTQGNDSSSSVDAWLCAHVSPLFCPGIPDLRYTAPSQRLQPQKVNRAQAKPKDLKDRTR